MNFFLIVLIAAFLLSYDTATACSILNQEKVQVGSRQGVKGVCSNNKLPITCILMEGTGIECNGPAGGYLGHNPASLVFSACGCSAGQEREQQLKKELEKR